MLEYIVTLYRVYVKSVCECHLYCTVECTAFNMCFRAAS